MVQQIRNPLEERYDSLRVVQGSLKSASSDDPFIVKAMHLILSYGAEARASDIHIEPFDAGARIRYRIDGMLHEMLRVPQEISEPMTRAIKLKANMATDTVGRSKPQDSRLELEHDNRKLDLRVSSFPTLHGDVITMRVLDRAAPRAGLEQLGFAPDTLERFTRQLRRPNGMLLVTGPTNSGKTSTLYAALEKLKSPHIKIITLEDPIEYQIDGIDQAQINPQVGVTFASGLRAILRQDSNVILVGEIRDQETAEIAIRAALTGHLVFSTLHARNAAGATARLVEMQIEPHLIVTSLTGVVAQRLVRVLCPKCKVPDPGVGSTFTRLWNQETTLPCPDPAQGSLSKGTGCRDCNLTGYKGRIGIYEFLVLNDDLKQLILERASNQLHKASVVLGMRTMRIDGLEKAYKGVTTIEEVLRVIGETED